MDLIGEDIKSKKSKGKKYGIAIIIILILLIISIITIMYLIEYRNSLQIKLIVDKKTQQVSQNIIMKDEQTGKYYFSIRDIASLVQYEVHNGEYKLYSEDTNKCYVENKQETASFFLNSKIIKKVKPDTADNYVEFIIDEPVKNINGKLYTTADGISTAFNITIYINKNTINFYTLDYAYNESNKKMIEYGYASLSEEFDNKKAMLYDLYVVKNANGRMGVVDQNGNEIIAVRYNNISFSEDTKEFFVTNAFKKVGIITDKGITKINLDYDNLKLLNKEKNLYIATQNGKKGVLKEDGEILIHLEYDTIGVNTETYSKENIPNQYLLFEDCIPVQRNEKWGIFDSNGNNILPVQYDALGSKNATKGRDVVLTIPTYEMVVIRKGEKYGLINKKGELVIPCELSEVYSVTTEGITNYYIVYQKNTMNLTDYMNVLNQTNR